MKSSFKPRFFPVIGAHQSNAFDFFFSWSFRINAIDQEFTWKLIADLTQSVTQFRRACSSICEQLFAFNKLFNHAMNGLIMSIIKLSIIWYVSGNRHRDELNSSSFVCSELLKMRSHCQMFDLIKDVHFESALLIASDTAGHKLYWFTEISIRWLRLFQFSPSHCTHFYFNSFW